MKPFVFKLQTSLDFKDKQEEQQKMELQRINLIYQENLEILRTLELRLYNMQNKIREINNSSVDIDIVEIKKYQDYIPFLKDKITQQIDVVHMLEIEIERVKEVLITISKEKKVLEKLKVKHLEEYKKEFIRQEQKTIDEMATNIYYRRDFAMN